MTKTIYILQIFLFFAVGFFVVIYLLPYFYAKISSRRLMSLCRQKKAVVLTYDDGPGETMTRKLLEVLHVNKVSATFFSLGFRADQSPDVLRLVVSEGHEMGCHGYRHCNAWKVWPHVVVRDISDGYKSLKEWIPSNGLFRPPHGKITLFSLVALILRRARPVWWTHDSGDTKNSVELSSIKAFVNRIISDGGGVVLMHDFDRSELGHVRHKFVESLTNELIQKAHVAGLRVITVSELLS